MLNSSGARLHLEAEHHVDDVGAGHHLRDAVLHLQPRVHLQEVEPARICLCHAFDGAGRCRAASRTAWRNEAANANNNCMRIQKREQRGKRASKQSSEERTCACQRPRGTPPCPLTGTLRQRTDLSPP